MFSSMHKSNEIITHHDADQSYILILKPSHGLVALFGDNVLSDKIWPADFLESECYKQSDAGMLSAQRNKAKDPVVFQELKKLRDMAERFRVPREAVLMVDCSDGGDAANPEKLSRVVRDAFAAQTPVTAMRGNQLWPTLTNRVGITLTNVLIDDVWDKTREEYCGLVSGAI